MDQADCVIVLVTLQHQCARLIRRGGDIALAQGRQLKVVHVAPRDENLQAEAKAAVLNDLYALANEAGAEMCLLVAEVMVTTVVEFAKEHKAKQIIIGAGENAHGIAETLSEMLPGVQILIVE